MGLSVASKPLCDLINGTRTSWWQHIYSDVYLRSTWQPPFVFVLFQKAGGIALFWQNMFSLFVFVFINFMENKLGCCFIGFDRTDVCNMIMLP